jgi:transcriptional regulator with XRE-family HTH domain
MRQRISARVDYEILADIALGESAKDIAKKHNVSISYVSKIKTGRKKIDVYIPESIQTSNKIAYYASDITALEEFFKTTPLSLEDGTFVPGNALDSLIIQKLAELKVLITTRKLLKGEKK